jgi:hypothetical protein
MARLQKENAEEGASPQVLPPKLPARKVELIEATEKGRTA